MLILTRRIGESLIIGEDIEEDRKRFHVTDSGIVLVTPNMLDQYLYEIDKDKLTA